MGTVRKNIWVLLGLLLTPVQRKLPVSRKAMDSGSQNICPMPSSEQHYLEIPTYIRQGRVLSEL